MNLLKANLGLAIAVCTLLMNCNVALAERSASGSLSCAFSGKVPIKKASSSQITILTNNTLTNADVNIHFDRFLKNKKKDVQGSLSAFFEAVEGSSPVASGETRFSKVSDFRFEISVRSNNNGKTFKITNQLPDGTFLNGKAVTKISTFDGMNLSGSVRFVLPRTLRELNIQEGGVFSVKQTENGKVIAKCKFEDLTGMIVPNG